MASFFCKFCRKEIVDSPVGYITFCPHYPPENEKTKDTKVSEVEDMFKKLGIRI